MVRIASDEVVYDQKQAAEFCRMSRKTFDRPANEGADLGRIKTGRRVLYLRSKLTAWLATVAADNGTLNESPPHTKSAEVPHNSASPNPISSV